MRHIEKFFKSNFKRNNFLGLSLPNFWLALILILVFSVKLNLFPVISGQDFKGLILPACCLSIPMICSYTRMIQNALLEQLNQDYVVGLKARGMSSKEIYVHHVLPHVLTTLSSLLGLSIGHLLGGTAIIETIFSYQGLGNMVIEAIRYRDYPIIQAYALYMALIYVCVNFFVDFLQQVLNPQLRRVRHEKEIKIKIILVVCLLLVAILGSLIAPYDPLKVNYNLSLQGPSLSHLFGTDKLGRDILSRILCGAKTSFGLTFLMLFLIVIIGVSIGLFAGLLGGKAEHFLNSLMNGI